MTREENKQLKKFEAWLDEHEEVISVGMGAFIVTFFIMLGILIWT